MSGSIACAESGIPFPCGMQKQVLGHDYGHFVQACTLGRLGLARLVLGTLQLILPVRFR